MNYNERIDIEERKNKSKFSLIVSGEKERGKAERVSPPKRKDFLIVFFLGAANKIVATVTFLSGVLYV